MTSRPASPLRRRLVVLPALALVLSGLLAACGDDEEPSSTPSVEESTPVTPTESKTSKDTKTPEPAGAEVDVEVKGDSVTPVAEDVEIGVGETVTLHVTSDRAGELHVHSSPEQEKEFGPGKTDVEITIDKPGSVDVEEHESDNLILRILVS